MTKLLLNFNLDRMRSLFRRKRLPPGEMEQLYQIEKSNRLHLLDLAKLHGPIFKSAFGDLFHVSIIGISRCRRFLKEHKASIRPYTIKVEHLIPHGFMRQMEGDVHAHYRRVLLMTLRESTLSDLQADLEHCVTEGLKLYRESLAKTGAYGPQVFLNTLNTMATQMLVRIFFGARPGTKELADLLAGFHALGPQGVVWNPGERQEQAFKALTALIRTQLLAQNKEGDGLAVCAHAKDMLDDTMLGNMIYMVEMGRYDIKALFRWLSKYGSEHQDVLERIAAEDMTSVTTRSLAEAFVWETLRTDQSERLMRIVEKEIVFDGYIIPKDAMVRLCMWEAHHSGKAFNDPFAFRPERFLKGDPDQDIFSPFGLGHHRCPLAQTTLDVATTFIRVLAKAYYPSAVGNDKPVRGAYHWEPSPNFYIELTPKVGKLHDTIA